MRTVRGGCGGYTSSCASWHLNFNNGKYISVHPGSCPGRAGTCSPLFGGYLFVQGRLSESLCERLRAANGTRTAWRDSVAVSVLARAFSSSSSTGRPAFFGHVSLSRAFGLTRDTLTAPLRWARSSVVTS